MMVKKLNSEEKEYCKQYAETNSEVILSELGLNLDKHFNVKCSCPVHDGDNKYGFSWNNTKKIWSCWTNKCHIKYGRSIIGLIAGIKNISYDEACGWLVSNYNLDLSSIDYNNLVLKKFIRKNSKTKVNQNEKFYTLNWFKVKDTKVNYLVQKGFSPNIISEFDCFICKDSGHPLYDKLVVPIRDKEGNILGFSSRNLNNNPLYTKWTHFPSFIHLNSTLYGFNKSQDYIKNCKKVIVVEAPLDMMMLYQNGIYNSVALLGSDLSADRLKLLVDVGVTEIILALDPDFAGISASEIIEDYVRLYFNVINVTTMLPSDPSDMSSEQIENILGVYKCQN